LIRYNTLNSLETARFGCAVSVKTAIFSGFLSESLILKRWAYPFFGKSAVKGHPLERQPFAANASMRSPDANFPYVFSRIRVPND
jgi:hypothetical protein